MSKRSRERDKIKYQSYYAPEVVDNDEEDDSILGSSATSDKVTNKQKGTGQQIRDYTKPYDYNNGNDNNYNYAGTNYSPTPVYSENLPTNSRGIGVGSMGENWYKGLVPYPTVLVPKDDNHNPQGNVQKSIYLKNKEKEQQANKNNTSGGGGGGGGCNCDEEEKKEQTGKEIGEKAAQTGNTAAGSGTSSGGVGSESEGSTGGSGSSCNCDGGSGSNEGENVLENNILQKTEILSNYNASFNNTFPEIDFATPQEESIKDVIDWLLEHSRAFKDEYDYQKRSFSFDIKFETKTAGEMGRPEGWKGATQIWVRKRSGQEVMLTNYLSDGGDGTDVKKILLKVVLNPNQLNNLYQSAISLQHEITVHCSKFARALNNNASFVEKVQALANETPDSHHAESLTNLNSLYNKINKQLLEHIKSAGDFNTLETPVPAYNYIIGYLLDNGHQTIDARNNSSYNKMVQILNSAEGLPNQDLWQYHLVRYNNSNRPAVTYPENILEILGIESLEEAIEYLRSH